MEMTTMSIRLGLASWLPNELWMNIISFLDVGDLGEISLVNSRFHSLLEEPSVWRTLCLQNNWMNKDKEKKSRDMSWKRYYIHQYRTVCTLASLQPSETLKVVLTKKHADVDGYSSIEQAKLEFTNKEDDDGVLGEGSPKRGKRKLGRSRIQVSMTYFASGRTKSYSLTNMEIPEEDLPVWNDALSLVQNKQTPLVEDGPIRFVMKRATREGKFRWGFIRSFLREDFAGDALSLLDLIENLKDKDSNASVGILNKKRKREGADVVTAASLVE